MRETFNEIVFPVFAGAWCVAAVVAVLYPFRKKMRDGLRWLFLAGVGIVIGLAAGGKPQWRRLFASFARRKSTSGL